jgi:antirestriction protein ArdC
VGGRAFYRPSTDSIQVPARGAFIGTPARRESVLPDLF